MKVSPILLAITTLLAAGCSAEKSAPAVAETTATPVVAPDNGDWSTIVTRTDAGGFMMGNPAAKVKLVEIASLTCHYCADFEMQGAKPLVDNYVKKGLVSLEFRNYVRDQFDMTASLIARCGGEAGFFGLTRNLYADQATWLGKIQSADPAQMQALEKMTPAQRFSTIADFAGLKQYASQRGVPRAKTDKCLADEPEVNRLVQMNSDAASQYNIPGTPSFVINDALVEIVAGTPTWTQLETSLKKALSS